MQKLVINAGMSVRGGEITDQWKGGFGWHSDAQGVNPHQFPYTILQNPSCSRAAEAKYIFYLWRILVLLLEVMSPLERAADYLGLGPVPVAIVEEDPRLT